MKPNVRALSILIILVGLFMIVNSTGIPDMTTNDYVTCYTVTLTSSTTATLTSSTTSTDTTYTSSGLLNENDLDPNQVTEICETVSDGCNFYVTETYTVTVTSDDVTTSVITSTATTVTTSVFVTSTPPPTSTATGTVTSTQTITSTGIGLNQEVTCTVTEVVTQTGSTEQWFAISNPEDQIIDFGSVGNSFVWQIDASTPSHYEIYMNDELIVGDKFNEPSSVEVPLDDLEVGEYKFEIVVYDQYGNSANDIVFVNVVESTKSTSKSPEEEGNVELPFPSVFVFSAFMVFISLVRYKNRDVNRDVNP